MELDKNMPGAGFFNDFLIPDKDVSNPDIIENAFKHKYYPSKQDSILNTSLGCLISANKSKEITFISTENTLIYFDVNTFSEKLSFKPHKGLVTDLKFAPSNPNLLYTSSLDATIKMWDLRCNKEEATFMAEKSDKILPITAFDVSKQETVLCGGTELVNEDTFLLFWDIRQNNQLGGYWESHADNITCVKFSNDSSNYLATSGCDCILNIFDISKTGEADALIYTLNTEDIVDTICWHKEKIICLTDVHSVQLWDIKDSYPILKYDRKELSNAMGRSEAYECYCIPLLSEGSAPDPIILTGSGLEHTSSSCLRSLKLDMQSSKLLPHGMLINDNYEVTQCAVHFEEDDSFLTIGENGTITAWRLSISPNSLKMQMKKLNSMKKKPY